MRKDEHNVDLDNNEKVKKIHYKYCYIFTYFSNYIGQKRFWSKRKNVSDVFLDAEFFFFFY
jgi:hypothetical protein